MSEIPTAHLDKDHFMNPHNVPEQSTTAKHFTGDEHCELCDDWNADWDNVPCKAKRHFQSPLANEGLEAIATRIVKWKHSLTMSEVISALNQVVAKVTKERDEWKQICRNRDETVNKQGDEWVKLKTQIDQLLRDKEALQKVAKVCDSKISRVFAEADRGIEIAKQAILALTKTNK